MLSDDEKKEMLADAQSESRRKAFAQARSQVINKPISWAEYISFLKSVQNLFPQQKTLHKIEGKLFKL
jgi:hypothetical protein